jgi:photosystem II stability/assembly factor-like uncharacterized protein
MRGVEREAARTVMVFLVFAYSAFLGPACSPSESPAPTAVLEEQVTADDFNSLPAIYGFTGPDNLISGQTCEVAISCAAADSDGQVKSVTADLSEIGGPKAQALTANGNLWSWAGPVTPLVAGPRKIVFTAIDDSSAAATYATNVLVSSSAPGAATVSQSFPATNMAVTGRVVQGQACPITVWYWGSSSGTVMQSVRADLSQIGGPSSQPLTYDGAQWMWSGTVIAGESGIRRIRIDAVDSTGAPTTAEAGVGVVNSRLLYADWLLLMASPLPQNPNDVKAYLDSVVAAIQKTRIPVVMLVYSLWDWGRDGAVLTRQQTEYLVKRLRDGGQEVAFHCQPISDLQRDPKWLFGDNGNEGALERLALLQAKIAYAEGVYKAPFNPQTDQQSVIRQYQNEYKSALRSVIGEDGILLASKGFEGDTDLVDGRGAWDQGWPTHTWDFAHPRQYVEWCIKELNNSRTTSPGWVRYDLGWIGECFTWHHAAPVVRWPARDYQYVWRRAREEHVPLTYRTSMESLVARYADPADQSLVLIGAMETPNYTFSNTDKRWSSVAISSDGATLAAAACGGRVYTSIDGGATWTQTLPAGDTDKPWSAVAVSADGTRLCAAANEGRAYLASLSQVGAWIWSEAPVPANPRPTDRAYTALAMSVNGTRLAATCDAHLFWSSNAGRNWDFEWQHDPLRQTRFYGVGMSADGTRMVTTSKNGLFTSPDAGATWTLRSVPGEPNFVHNDSGWGPVAMSADGTRIVAVTWPGRVFFSADSGANWTQQYPAGDTDHYWQCAAMSADGRQMVVGEWNGRLYMATHIDNAWVWRELQPAGDVNAYWESVALSADGSTIIATDGERLFTSTDAGTTWTARQPAATQ